MTQAHGAGLTASRLNLSALHYALRPAAEDHRYGQGKAEAVADP